MEVLSAEQIEQNYKTHKKIISHYLSSERTEKIFDFYNKIEEHLILAPASTKPWYHNAFPGGYIDHVNRVVKLSLKIKDLWQENKSKINFTDEELVFSAIFHDLGKLGDIGKPGYHVQTDTWRRNNLQEFYTYNTELSFMLVPDRSLFLLQKYGISYTENEFLGIKLHDGLYEDSNRSYYISNVPTSQLKTNLPHILHQADLTASKIEKDLYYYGNK